MNKDQSRQDDAPSDRLVSSRRDFFRLTALATGGFIAGRSIPSAPAQTLQSTPASTPTADPLGQIYRQLIPANKNLDPAWVRSLFERGQAARYTKSQNQLRKLSGLEAASILLAP
jgi:hypothetical protein